MAALTEDVNQPFDPVAVSVVGQKTPIVRAVERCWSVLPPTVHRPLILTLAFTLLLLAWLLWKPGSASEFVVYAASIGSAALGAIFAFLPAWPPRANETPSIPASPKIPLCLGLATLCVAIGTALWAYDDQVAHLAMPSPSLACALSFGAYPLVLVAILRLPRRRAPSVVGSHAVVDSLMLLVGGATISWYFVLGPDLLQSSAGLVSQIMSAGYPFFDLLLLSCLVLLTTRAREAVFALPSWILGIGLSCIVISDSVYSYQSLHGTYLEGQPSSIGWPLGLMLIGVAARALRSTAVPIRAAQPVPELAMSPIWRFLLPNFPLPLLAGLLILAWMRGSAPALQVGVAIGFVTIAFLGRVRQFLTMLDNRRLYDRAMRLNERLSHANARLEELSTTDPLTGLANHRALNVALDNEIDHAHRFGCPFALLFIDLDHFKAINDAYGHPVGDAILREAGQVLREAFNSSSLVGRWGGEEFVALVPDANPASCAQICEEVRKGMASHQFATDGGHLTCSIGYALYLTDARTRDDLIGSADRALYVAKRLGRNQVRNVADPTVRALSAGDAHDRDRESSGRLESRLRLLDSGPTAGWELKRATGR